MAVANAVNEGITEHRKNCEERHGWRAVITQMSGRFEDSAAFRGYINKNNLDISPLELREASNAVVKKCAELIEKDDLPVKILFCSGKKDILILKEMYSIHILICLQAVLLFTHVPLQ